MTRRAEFLATRPRRSGQSHRYLAENPATGESLPVTLHADAKTTPTLMYEQSGRATATVANAWALPAGPPDGAPRSVTFMMHNAGARMTAALNTRKRLQVTAQ